jgi:hypothetical protein
MRQGICDATGARRIAAGSAPQAACPVRRAVLLVAGDKAGNWQRWHDVNLPSAEERYQTHVTALETREYE